MTAIGGYQANSSRQSGDAARDRQEWTQAASFYQRHLAVSPADASIWAQLGHALKESGQLREAETAYRTALSLTPGDGGLLLQIGHLMKRMDRMDEAVRSYAASMRLVPTFMAFRELVALRKEALARRLLANRKSPSAKPHVHLQMTDFFNYLLDHKAVSGIQRVQLGVMHHVLSMSADTRQGYSIVHSRGDESELWAVRPVHLRAVVECVSGPEVDHDTLRRRIGVALDEAEATRLRAGDTFVILGSFWGGSGNLELLRSCNENGVCAGIFFHDLLPVTHAEYFDSGTVSDFQRAVSQALALADFGLSNSEYTASEVRRFIISNELREIPIVPVPLAHTLREPLPSSDSGLESTLWPDAIAALRDRPFVLCVATIEARKNHRYLFDAWKLLISQGEEVPNLVFVGRQGWRVDELMAQLQSTNYLDGRIRIINDLSDAELGILYRHCLFTVFPSIVEGWGLPIGESLSYGKVCVGSNTSSMPEVGGDLVEYIDPLNLRGGIETFRRLIKNPAWITARETVIQKEFRPRTWYQVGADLVAKIDILRADLGPKTARSVAPNLEPGQAFSLSSHAYDLQDRSQRLLQLALTGTWFPRENIGVWMAGYSAGLEFLSSLGPDVPVVVLVRLNVVHWVQDNTVTIADRAGASITAILNPGIPIVMRLKTTTMPDGRLALSLVVGGRIAQVEHDRRLICVGLSCFGYAAQSDAGSRLSLLEDVLELRLGRRRQPSVRTWG